MATSLDNIISPFNVLVILHSQTKWSVLLKITLMKWLFEYWTRWLFQERSNELIIWILKSLVISKFNIKLIFFEH